MTHEVRLSSNPDSKLIWQVGAMHYSNQLENTNTVYLSATQDPTSWVYTDAVHKDTKAFGAFAQATYPVTDTWRVTAGVRYDKTKVDVNESFQQGPFLAGPGPLPPPLTISGDAGKREFSNKTYKLRLEHDLSKDNLLYASVSTGFSPGDVTVASSCLPFPPGNPCAVELAAETLTSYEIGSKNRFLDDTLQVNATTFYSKYGAFQSAGININPAGFPPFFGTLSTPLETYGLEFETLYKFTPMDLLGLNVGWTKAHYVNKPALFAQFVAEEDVTSNSGPSSVAPIPLSASLSYEHTFVLSGDSTLALRGEALYSSRHIGDVTQAQKNDGQQPFADIKAAVLGNLSATWTANKNLSVTGYVRNVTDHQYFIKNQVNALVVLGPPGPPPVGPPPPTTYIYQQTLNDPRTFGVVLNVSF